MASVRHAVSHWLEKGSFVVLQIHKYADCMSWIRLSILLMKITHCFGKVLGPHSGLILIMYLWHMRQRSCTEWKLVFLFITLRPKNRALYLKFLLSSFAVARIHYFCFVLCWGEFCGMFLTGRFDGRNCSCSFQPVTELSSRVCMLREIPSQCNAVCRQKHLKFSIPLTSVWWLLWHLCPFGRQAESAAALYGACIKAYFCLDEFNGNFVFKCSSSPIGFLLLQFILWGVCVQTQWLPLASSDLNMSWLLITLGRWGFLAEEDSGLNKQI